MKKNLSKIRQIKSVNILGRKYKVKQVSNLVLNGERCGGMIDPNKKIIYMDKNLIDQDYLDVLIHEVTHLVLFTNGIDQTLSNMEIEIICQSMASGISDLILGSIL